MSDPSAPQEIIFESQLGVNAPAYLSDYQRVQGIVVLPVTAYLEMALAAAEEALGSGPHSLEEVSFQQPLFLPEDRVRTVRLAISPADDRGAAFKVLSAPLDADSQTPWTLHASGLIRRGRRAPSAHSAKPARISTLREPAEGVDFSLFYFGSGPAEYAGGRYDLLLEGAKFADRNGFSAVWTPERHFHPFGGSYPAPAILSAALATVTERVHLRAGSVVLPLHHPIRVAEEWSVIDNLSGGRVGVSFATGWSSDDFVLSPGTYDDRREVMFRSLELLRRFWRGETIEARGGSGKTTGVRLFPMPRQPELPVWLTIVKNPEMYERAGEVGANVLTNLLGQSIEELARNVALYRDSLRRHGHDPAAGHVTLLIHTFIGDDLGSVKDKVRKPFCDYLRSSVDIIQNLVKSLDLKLNLDKLSEADMDDLLSFAFERYFQSGSLLGTRDTALETVSRLKELGVNEVGCFIDFGVDFASVMAGLSHLNRLREAFNGDARGPGAVAAERNPLAAIRSRCAEAVTGASHYLSLRERGIDYGQSFQAVRQIRRGKGEALAELRLPPKLEPEAEAYAVHPALLDAGLQTLGALLPDDARALPGERTYLPTGLKELRVYARPAPHVWCHAQLHQPQEVSETEVLTGDVRLLDEDGGVIAEVLGVRLRKSEGGAGQPVLYPLHDLLYEIEWESQGRLPSSPRFPAGQPGRWLIFADASGVGQRLAEILAERGEACAVVSHAAGDDGSAGFYRVDPSDPDEMRRLLEDILKPSQHPLRGVVHLWSLGAAPPEAMTCETLGAAQTIGCESVLHLIQALTAVAKGDSPGLWLVTRGSRHVGTESAPVSIAQAPLWGLARVVQLEHPEFRCVSVDLDGRGGDDEARLLFEELWHEGNEDQVAHRDGERYVPRLTRLSPDSLPSNVMEHTGRVAASGDSRARPNEPLQHSHDLGDAASPFRSDCTYLITGGLGELGLIVARHMVARGARHLVLMGRGEPSGDARVVLDELRGLGAEVVSAQANVAREQEVARVLDEINREMPPLRGIVHAAMVIEDGVLVQMDRRRFDNAFEPKARGALNLHRLSSNLPLDFFLLFSSAVSLHGSAGQGNYVAANAFLDALAHERRRLGLPALAIDWGRWAEVFQKPQRRLRERMALLGMRPLQPEYGLRALEWLLRREFAQALVMSVDWEQVFKSIPTSAESPVLSRIVAQHVTAPAGRDADRPSTGTARAALFDIDPDLRQAWLEDHIKSLVAAVLRFSPDQIDHDQPLNTLGLDSLMAIEIKNTVEASLEITLPLVSLLEGPSVAQLAARIANELAEPTSSQSDQRLAQLLSQIQDLSDEEVKYLLAQEKLRAPE